MTLGYGIGGGGAGGGGAGVGSYTHCGASHWICSRCRFHDIGFLIGGTDLGRHFCDTMVLATELGGVSVGGRGRVEARELELGGEVAGHLVVGDGTPMAPSA